MELSHPSFFRPETKPGALERPGGRSLSRCPLRFGFWWWFLGAALAVAVSKAADTTPTINTASQPSGTTNSSTTNALDAEFEKIVVADDAAEAEVDAWRKAAVLKPSGTPETEAELNRRIRVRFEPVASAYADFVRRHPDHFKARLTYGNFLNDRQDEAGAQAQWEKALELDPNNAAACNNLAGRYSEVGPAKKAFELFTKAIELSPSDPQYYHNFGDSLYVLRQHAAKYYGISEQDVFGKVLLLFSNAARLDSTNFTFASDVAQTHYSLKPLRFDDALAAWTNALRVAETDAERQDVYVHLARVKMLASRLIEARAQLKEVTSERCSILKSNLLKAIEQRERQNSTPQADSH